MWQRLAYSKRTVEALDGRTNVSGTHLNIEDGPQGDLWIKVINEPPWMGLRRVSVSKLASVNYAESATRFLQAK